MKIAFFLNVGMSEDFYTIVEHVKFTAKKKKKVNGNKLHLTTIS